MDAKSEETFFERLRQIYVAEDGSSEIFDQEVPVLREAVSRIAATLGDGFELVEPLGRGGSGVVIKLTDVRLDVSRALKIPRPKDDRLIESVRNEIDHLKALQHPNIIRLHVLGDVDLAGYAHFPFFVMDFIEKRVSIRDALEVRLETASSRELGNITGWLAGVFLALTRAVAFLHDNRTIHFDIKPSNVLIDHLGQPLLMDLGFAKTKTESADATVAGFTLFYAHPDLSREYQHMSSQNRVRKPLQPRSFKFEWDIYALGKSVLELLAKIDQRFPDTVFYDYSFGYLHLLACRMLDGWNLGKDDVRRIWEESSQLGRPRSTYWETWQNLRQEDFKELRLSDIHDVEQALQKIDSEEPPLELVPELRLSLTERIQISDGAPAPFTDRVKAVVEHPVFTRLNSVRQLGFANSIYPGTTHTRFEHSLGAFRTCCLYVQALYRDPYNPFFRQIAGAQELRAVLLASLLHDLGQYPLAHETEEALRLVARGDRTRWEPFLKHERLTQKWLDHGHQDSRGRTLGQIVEDATDGWDVPLGLLKAILTDSRDDMLFRNQPLRVGMLRSIVDSPLDVDKVDYLVRDSRHSSLTYGDLIDVDRLVRSLTVVVVEEHGKTRIVLGTYEKGQSAAESLTFARYLLYQALYWHHTSRSVRVMWREILRRTLNPQHRVDGSTGPGSGKASPSSRKRVANRSGGHALFDSIGDFLGLNGEPKNVTVEAILDFVSELTDDSGRELLDLIKSRRYYKRILTVHRHIEEEGKQPLLDRFRGSQGRGELESQLQAALRTKLIDHRRAVAGPRETALSPENADKAIALLESPGAILCDAPEPSIGTTAEKLRFIPEPKRLLRNYSSRLVVGERVSEVWQEVHHRLMNIASKGRVFCHPDVRDTLMAALGPEGIRTALEDVI
jgi:HD superfamily phosphohydrolase